MKMMTTARYKKNWRKRVLMDDRGLTTVSDGTQVPCHMQADEWEMFFTAICTHLSTLIEEQGGDFKSGAKVFPSVNMPEMTEKFWNVRFGSHIQRIIFRNGVTRTDPFFIKYVMQHSESCDEQHYVKNELFEGPWM